MGGALQLVDLAGADFDDRDVTNSSTNSTTTTTAQQRKESIDINKSLLALKECFRWSMVMMMLATTIRMKIASLLALKECFRNVGTKGAKTSRGCFRGSKLTRQYHSKLPITWTRLTHAPTDWPFAMMTHWLTSKNLDLKYDQPGCLRSRSCQLSLLWGGGEPAAVSWSPFRL